MVLFPVVPKLIYVYEVEWMDFNEVRMTWRTLELLLLIELRSGKNIFSLTLKQNLFIFGSLLQACFM